MPSKRATRRERKSPTGLPTNYGTLPVPLPKKQKDWTGRRHWQHCRKNKRTGLGAGIGSAHVTPNYKTVCTWAVGNAGDDGTESAQSFSSSGTRTVSEGCPTCPYPCKVLPPRFPSA